MQVSSEPELAGRITLASLTRFETCTAALAEKINPSSAIRYEVELVWIDPGGSVQRYTTAAAESAWRARRWLS